MTARWSLPPRVRPLLVRHVERVLDDVEGPGTSPGFVATSLLTAVELACRDGGCADAVERLLDATGMSDVTDGRLRRRIEPGLRKLGEYEEPRWAYPDAAAVVALLERVLRIDWVDAAEPVAPEGPPAGTVPTPYGPDVALAEGAWIGHPTLGVGLVMKTQGDRIQVRFADRERTLVHRAIVAAPRVEVMSEEAAAWRATLDRGLADFARDWRALGRDPTVSFRDACAHSAGLHPAQLAKQCVMLAEATFGSTLARRTYDPRRGTTTRVSDRLLHEHYPAPAHVLCAAVRQRVRPSDTDDVEGLRAEILRRLAALAAG